MTQSEFQHQQKYFQRWPPFQNRAKKVGPPRVGPPSFLAKKVGPPGTGWPNRLAPPGTLVRIVVVYWFRCFIAHDWLQWVGTETIGLGTFSS